VYPGLHAQTTPDKPAVIMGRSGEVVTYSELHRASTQLARLWQQHGLGPGDHVAILSENQPRYFEVVWAALRSGLYVTTVNSHLSAEEVAYILEDSESRSLVTTTAMADVAAAALLETSTVKLPLLIGPADSRFESYDDAVGATSADPLDDEPLGDFMLYSSGTTGRPKGVKRTLSGAPVTNGMAITHLVSHMFGVNADSIYLSPAPLYHSAPLAFTLSVQALGGTVVAMEKFDAAEALALIDQHKVTHSQWVPTMFIRMLKLAEEERSRHDLSSLVQAIHAAAPCPVEVKHQMMDWWGPILWEYYGGTEGNGFTFANPQEWLQRPGTVGKSLGGEVHILDDAGEELPPGEVGTIYFAGGFSYEYHKDPDKTAGARDPKGRGWTTLGDVGYLDAEGWLYLTDRKAFMIISGGVNIYPQEIENCLIMHPKVADVAVFGIPDAEMGEAVHAAIQPAAGIEAGDALEAELRDHVREHIAHYKCPRTFEFLAELPRLPSGKLYKRKLRDKYWRNGHG